MKKTTENLLLLGMVFCTALVLSNVIAAKTVPLGFSLFGGPAMVPAAVLCYPVTFLVTDVVGELWGKREAQRIVGWGFACQLLATCVVVIAGALPAADPDAGAAYQALLGQNAVFVAASMSAYLLSQSWDVWVFHRIRGRMLGRGSSPRQRWIWNNASTMTSQVIDTVVYITIAFGLGMGWLFDAGMHATLAAMVVAQYLVKFVFAALDTPLFYLLTRRPRR